MTDLPAFLLTQPAAVPEQPDVAAWHPRFRSVAALAGTPFALAVRGGFDADRLAWAFSAGYQAATRALVPGCGPDEIVSFCMTEPGGNRPRDLRSRCRPAPGGGWQLDGDKRWATLAPVCSTCLVVATLAEPDAAGRTALGLLRVPTASAGVQLTLMPPTKFVPEAPHGELALRGVALPADALLPGDGWEDHGKPFRTLEDTLVTAAALAYLLREARARAWPGALVERGLAALLSLQAVAALPPQAASTHVALAGALAAAQALFQDAGALWAATPDDAASQRWQRDAAVLGLARATQAQRLARAWERLAPAA